MGKKYQILKENIFDQIAKMIALSQLKREIPKAIKLIEEDPITVSTLENLQYHAQKIIVTGKPQ